MIKLFREATSPQADAIEAELQDLLLGYDRVVMDPAEARKQFGPAHSLPILTNNERVVSGEEPLKAYLKELRILMQEWQAFQGDSCYVDEDGKPC